MGPKTRPTEFSKPWWNEEITTLRKLHNTAFRAYKKQQQNIALREKYTKSRNQYFQAIRNAKQESWISFLESLKNQDVFTALKYTKEKRLEQNP